MKIYSNFTAVLSVYAGALKKCSEEQIRRKPSADKWSLRQLYSHLILSSKDFYLPAVERCIKKDCGFKPGGKNLVGFVIVSLGWMPPFKFKVVKHQQYTANADWDKNQIEKELILLDGKVKALTNAFPNSDMNYKDRHSTLGWLNAEEWLQTDIIHYKHHLHQLIEIGTRLNKSSNEA